MLSRILAAGQKHLRPSSLFLTAALGLSAHTAQAADTKLTMGTGAKSGYYFAVGSLLCTSFAQGTVGYKCIAKATDGPRENLPKLRRGKFNLVVARSDWAQDALKGAHFFKNKGADTSLHSLFSINSAPLTVIARAGSDIRSVDDLNGKRVNLDGSATHLVQQLPRAANWDTSAFDTYKPNEKNPLRKQLCLGDIDAVAIVVSYPASWIQKTARTCPIQLVSASGRQIDRLVSRSDALSKDTIPANTYKGVASPTKTFGFRATLLSSAKVPEDDVYAFVKSTFENLPQLARNHPALSGLQPSIMIREGLTAPLHPGAVRYYRERGWIK
ncbi:TAXI family TRAP transporter solute-binding subunit [Ruegeria meonggei]|uniref:TAXI family TRAP transporter solute-binding subunit n=1 Tax=Ruegeria meonggei TaxID=1446476 RepID=UPI00366A9AAA